MPKTKNKPAYIVTGPTSGIGRETALVLAKHGTVVLVGRDRAKLDEMQKIIERRRGSAVSVVCDLSDIGSVKRAAAEIVARMIDAARANGPMKNAPLEFVVGMMTAVSDATIDFMVRDKANAEKHCLAGFEAFHRMIA